MCDDFEKLVDNTGITVGCVNKKLSAETRSYRRMEFQIKKIPKWRRSRNEEDQLYKRRKSYEERINTFISLSSYVEKHKVLRYHSRMAKRINVPDNIRFNYLELFNNFVKLLLRSVYRRTWARNIIRSQIERKLFHHGIRK